MIQVTDNIAIDEHDIHEEFIHSSGPGGQKINKVATAVQLSLDVVSTSSLPDEVRRRLIFLARNRINRNGLLIIKAKRFRTQGRNRQDALERLTDLLRRAATEPKKRHKTSPPCSSKVQRLKNKWHRGVKKNLRYQVKSVDE
jgi:ribosome-associated protein